MPRNLLGLAVLLVSTAAAQRIEIRQAPPLSMPGDVDSNSPAFWIRGRFHLLNSTGNGPMLSRGWNQFRLGAPQMSHIVRLRPWPAWIEAVWVDPTGVSLGWYHQEQEYLCGAQRPALPQIGAAISYDGGNTFHDVGIVLASAERADCRSKNGYFAGGHGDFTVVLDRNREYFYFFFGNYGGPVETQGVAVGRMAYGDRFQPAGKVRKFDGEGWNQPGVGGRVEPIFPAAVSWQLENTDSFWGPSVHWNTYLEKWVMLLNRSCCSPGWPQEGIYAAFSADLKGWSKPTKILSDTGWYPQVLGLGPGETDSVAGRIARLYIYGRSSWHIVFRKGNTAEPASPE
jgi:hypothetical protein